MLLYESRIVMNEQTQKTNWVPYAIIAVVIVLTLLVLYPKSKNAKKLAEQQPQKVTVENEFTPETEIGNTDTAMKNDVFTFKITSPQNGTTSPSKIIKITGTTTSGADVFVNENDAKADSRGNFSVSYTLEEGENYLIVGANDENGNFDEVDLMIYYEG
ncbi:MAG: hypothetical protein AAB874_01060 [Patescibacteria group bacterium]